MLSAAVACGGSVALGGSLWRGVAATADEPPLAMAQLPAATPGARSQTRPAGRGVAESYGRLRRPDDNGIRVPAGFTTRVVARSGRRLPGTDYRWHDAPDGGACFATGKGWIYVSNSELNDGRGGASALRFGPNGAVRDAYRILAGTSRNCAGGATPWGSWLSCEEVDLGYVDECFPLGGPAVRRPALGRFKHEAAAIDPERQCVYLTEDQDDGCLYRFVPARWPSLDAGRLEVLCGGKGTAGPITWSPVPDPTGKSEPTRRQVPGAKRFDGGEGCVYGAGTLWFTTKGDGRVWALDATRDVLDLAYDEALISEGTPLRGVDNITRAAAGDLFIAEDNGSMEICMISPGGVVSSFLHLTGQPESEITGPAFSPDGTRLYFSSQRGSSGRDSGGLTYEVRGPFRT